MHVSLSLYIYIYIYIQITIDTPPPRDLVAAPGGPLRLLDDVLDRV